MAVYSVRNFGMLCILAIFQILFLSACGISLDADSQGKLSASSDSCSSQSVKDRYIVAWKDGSITEASFRSRDQFENEFFSPHANEIDFVENDQIVHLISPIAPEISYSLRDQPNNWGQERIDASTEWSKGVTGEGAIVAVIDTGVDVSHPQLKNQVYRNPKEIVNGIDDDLNGYIDDVTGWNFLDDNNQVYNANDYGEARGHGTHVSGIIAADHRAGLVEGVAPKAKIMPLKFMNARGDGRISDAIKAMYYAANNGAKIINASWGGPNCSKSLQKAIADLSTRGIMFVTAAGNGDDLSRGQNIDLNPIYPAAFSSNLQISVGASNYFGKMASFSNFSQSNVHLLAPGVSILSTYPNFSTEVLDGTSMATPFVSGAAALLWSHWPDATAIQIRQAILSSVDLGDFPVLSKGILNVSNADKNLEILLSH